MTRRHDILRLKDKGVKTEFKLALQNKFKELENLENGDVEQH